VDSGTDLLANHNQVWGKWGRTYPKAGHRGIPWKNLLPAWKGAWNNLGLGKLI
jgi:hypothetical protein